MSIRPTLNRYTHYTPRYALLVLLGVFLVQILGWFM